MHPPKSNILVRISWHYDHNLGGGGGGGRLEYSYMLFLKTCNRRFFTVVSENIITLYNYIQLCPSCPNIFTYYLKSTISRRWPKIKLRSLIIRQCVLSFKKGAEIKHLMKFWCHIFSTGLYDGMLFSARKFRVPLSECGRVDLLQVPWNIDASHYTL